MVAPLADLNLLPVFEALFEERSVTAAAKRIGMGQPGMSAALGRLRAAMGDELFIRVAGEMRPTAKAVELAPGLVAALAQIRRTLDAERGFDPATAIRSFAIGSTDYTAAVLLPPLMRRLRDEAPGVDLRVVGYDKGDLGGMLDRGEIDAALGVFPQPPGRAVVTTLFQERFVGIARAGHPAIVAGRVAAQAFAALPHALVTTRRDAAGDLDTALAALGLTRRVVLALPYFMALPAVLADSDLVSAVPSRLADMVTAVGGLQRFDIPFAAAPWSMSLLWPATARRDKATAWFRGLIRACAARPIEAAADGRI